MVKNKGVFVHTLNIQQLIIRNEYQYRTANAAPWQINMNNNTTII